MNYNVSGHEPVDAACEVDLHVKPWIKFAIPVIVAWFVILLIPAAGRWSLEGNLRTTCSAADRVVVQLITRPGHGPPEHVDPGSGTFEVVGKSKIDQLLSALQFSDRLDSACGGCFGDLTLRFYNGNTPLKWINIHDGETVYWTRGMQMGEYELTDESKSALRDWLKANGCPTPDEAEEIALRIWRSSQASEGGSNEMP